jgi:O-antigen/teichoic acid export membrane protein
VGYHAIIYGAAFFVPALLGFTTFATLTHLLNTVEYGVYSTANSFAFFAGSFFFGWIRFAAGRYEAEGDHPIAIRFWVSCFLAMIPLVILTLVLTVVFKVAPLEITFSIFLLSAAQSLFEISQEFLRARRRSSSFAVYNVTRSVISISLAVAIAVLIPKGSYLTAGLAASFLVCAVTNLWTQAHNNQGSPRTYDIKTVLTFGSGLAVSGLVFSSISVIPRLMVVSMIGVSSAGPYNAAADMAAQIGGIIGLSVYSIVGPTVIRAYVSSGVEGARKEFIRGGELFFAAMLPATAGLMIVSNPLVSVVTGAAFHDVTAYLLPYMIVSVCLSCFNSFYLHIAFQITSKPFLQVLSGAIQVAVLYVSVYFLIQVDGVRGAAIALIVASLIGVGVTFAFARTVFPIPVPLLILTKVVICTAAMSVVSFYAMQMVNSNIAKLVIAVTSGGATYALLALALNVCNTRTWLAQQFRRRQIAA